jgi:2-oxoglutarate/2-oxoacid ferredoxin oxidoreductase subunit alpha
MTEIKQLETVVIRFAGDSGDGMQTIGEQFTDSSALIGNDISTFPDFPAEIRAPIGTLPGVSGFQLQFGSKRILTPGDAPDALVAMNPAALKVNLAELPKGGLLVVNLNAFTDANIKKAGYEANPLDDPKIDESYDVVRINVNDLTKTALEALDLKPSDKVRCKNFFVLGFMYWVYGRSLDFTKQWLNKKWAKKPILAQANIKAMNSGFNLGLTMEKSRPQYRIVKIDNTTPGTYRKITGNEATLLGLVTASEKSKRGLFFAGYPITPASDILEGLSKHKKFGVKTVQAEDEIAAIGIALGASFTGKLAVTATSGPGICLKSEFIGLAVSTELPLVIINVQRGGPSTGLPTKTEQSDLLLSLFGRHGESPMPVIAAKSPVDCFEAAIEASAIALKYNTPVMLLTDGYIANGSEPWNIPNVNDIAEIDSVPSTEEGPFVVFKRDKETLARKIAIPGQPGLEHRLGGLEKDEAGNVSYDSLNHEQMTDLRARKVAGIEVPDAIVNGKKQGAVLVVSWGGTYGAVHTAVNELQQEGIAVSNVHLRNLNPMPKNLGAILKRFNKVLVPELNSGQLDMLIRSKYLVDTIKYSKIQGKPFTVEELKTKITQLF